MSELSKTDNLHYRERKISENSFSDGGGDDEDNLQFKPIVQLPLVEIKTNEEDEIVLLKTRAKLYRFDKTDEPYEWKERGVGELKILQNEQTNAIRIVMRRDKTYKVCANHFITPWIDLKPFTNNEKTFLYTVPADFADEEMKPECLAIRFATVDNANLFKCKFEEAREIVKTKCKLYNGEYDKEIFGQSTDNDTESDNESNEQEEVTEKLSELSVENRKDS